MTHPDLTRWLDKVTRGLPKDLAETMRDEITAHYEDAFDEYCASGLDDKTAHQYAMCDLGDTATMQDAVKEAYQTDLFYLLAAFIGMGYPLIYLLTIPLNDQLVGSTVFNLAIFLPLLYCIYSVRNLLRNRLNAPQTIWLEHLIYQGVTVVSLARFVGWVIYGRPTVIESYGRNLGEVTTIWELLLNATSIGAMLVIGIGFVLLGWIILSMRDNFDWLLKPTACCMMFAGFGSTIYGISTAYGMINQSVYSEMLIVFSSAIAAILWAYIFLRQRTTLLQYHTG